MENMKELGFYEIEFSKPDIYGEVHANIEVLLDMSKNEARIDFSINKGEKIRFAFSYSDAGTCGFSRFENKFSIQGRLVNISLDWAKPNDTDIFKIINVLGIWEYGKGKLHLWMKQKNK